MHFTIFPFLLSNCSKRRKADHNKSVASDIVSEDVVERKESLTTARPNVKEKPIVSSSTELQGKVTKKKLRDLSDEPSLSRSKLQGSSELESEESQKGRAKQDGKETASQPASPQAQGLQAQEKPIVEHTQVASIAVTPHSQDIEPTQCPEPSPIGTRTEGTPPPSLTDRTEKNESTNSSGQTASKDSPVPLHMEKLESPVPANGEKMESPVPANGEKMESPVPGTGEKIESPNPAHSEKVGSGEKVESAPSSIIK
ncbi:hypothetical protein Y032_0077g1142 [Ancylostoma ceylanicum]|uniref:Uncharacterized protein n=1 Tax=Ancylostoma ceylanicum TaxID=53326 RepID=A0A016TU79_9BILA|nr:hypothetical protein Y032_0077g1142 [Ancylostoma ceylanicum]